jgi:membrane associated rhomboid family serine protease
MAGGVLASLAFFLFNTFVVTSTFHLLGASGAVFTILTLAACYFPNSKAGLLFIPIQIPLKYLALIFIAIDLFSFSRGANSGIAHLAHLGGAAVGFILYFLWEKR